MLTKEVLATLTYADKLALAEWQLANTSNRFVPAAIRRMPLETRLALARSDELTATWQRREQLRCQKSNAYFVLQYGSVEPPVGDPEPFHLWDSQLDVQRIIERELRIIVGKARRLGLSWIGLHRALWLAGFNPETQHARALIFSKNLGDAGKLLDRVKRINERLPPFLSLEVGGKDSASTFAIRQAEITSLPATEGAARQETATFVMLDEFAFVRNEAAAKIWTAVQPTIEGGGQVLVVSTGNGHVGDGAMFAQLFKDAQAGRNSMTPIFLPWNARPDRTPEWLESERRNYESDEAFNAEYPATVDQMLAGDRAVRVYPIEGVNAAERYGRKLWEDERTLRLMRDEGIEVGTDWGDFQTFSVYALPLAGGGLYVIDELMQASTEPQDASWRILRHDAGDLRAPDGGKAHIVESRTDSAPAGTNASYASVLVAAQRDPELVGRVPDQNMRVPFSKYKEGGGERSGVNTVAFIKWLMRNSAKHVDADGNLTSGASVLAIHPRCKVLLAQLRNLERDPNTGKVKKPPADPKHVEQGDHGPDSLIALAASRAREWRATKESDE